MGKIIHLPKLKQDIIKSILGNPKLDSIVENIIKRKQEEKKKTTLGKKRLSQIPREKGAVYENKNNLFIFNP